MMMYMLIARGVMMYNTWRTTAVNMMPSAQA